MGCIPLAGHPLPLMFGVKMEGRERGKERPTGNEVSRGELAEASLEIEGA